MNRVMVLGSMNVDTIWRVDHMPLPGETISADQKTSAGGGKGANQAIAAARSGARTSFVGKVGRDTNGKFMIRSLRKEGIDTTLISGSKQNTGEACIILDRAGQNSIIVYGGANQDIQFSDIERLQFNLSDYDFLVTQFETPESMAVTAFRYAKVNHTITILNPAPAKKKIDPALLKLTDLIIPNETEAEMITGIKITDKKSMRAAAQRLTEKGAKGVVITLGSRGAYYHLPDKADGIMAAVNVQAIDTTAAGDTFIGAFSAFVQKDFSNLPDAIVFANCASSLAVQTLGAQPSIPTREAIQRAMRAYTG